MAPKDMETDGSPEQIGLATVYLWREVSGPRSRDPDLAYLLAATAGSAWPDLPSWPRQLA